jgi:CRP-like cAMP-binding protein
VQNNHSLFSGLPEIDKKNILDRCTRRKVQAKSVIVSQGSRGRDMFIVVSGSLRVSVLSDEGKEISFVILRNNDYFGELSLIDGRRRSATVTAIEPTELLVLSNAEYQHLLQHYPQTAIQFLTRMLLILVNRLRATDELYQDSVFLGVSSRLAKFLLGSSDEVVHSDSGERLMTIRLSQYELGTLVNASRESVNKQLRDWESQGVINVERGKISILEPERLQDIAEGY